MKILLVCAGGYSTSILMKKVIAYSQKNNLDVHIEAKGASMDELNANDFDVVLVAPQIRYKVDEIKQAAIIPVALIPAADYGAGKPEKILSIAEQAIKEK